MATTRQVSRTGEAAAVAWEMGVVEEGGKKTVFYPQGITWEITREYKTLFVPKIGGGEETQAGSLLRGSY
jgi:hypothetical protein